MVDFTDITNPNTSIDELGSSLLSRAQENTRQRRRARSPSGRDLLKSLGLQLAGHFAGDYLRSRFDNQLQQHLNDEATLQKRALVRASVNEASDILDFQRAYKKHQGGERGAVYEDLTARFEAQLKMQLGPDEAAKSDAHIKQIAREMADDNIDAHFKNYQARVTAAQKVNSVSGGDPFAYYKEIRNAAAADQSLLAQISRRATTMFRDENDKDADNALYKTVTSSKIYNTSKEYRDAFDKSYVEAGTALAASNVARYLEENKDNIRSKALSGEFMDIDADGDGQKEKFWVESGPDGRPVNFIRATNLMRTSPESMSSRRKLPKDGTAAEEYFVRAVSALSTEDREQVSDDLKYGGTDERLGKAHNRVVASDIYNVEQDLKSIYGDLGLTDERIQALAVRSVQIDRVNNEGRSRLINGNKSGGEITDNPLLTYQALVAEYGDADEIPSDIRTYLFEQRIPQYLGVDLAAGGSEARVDEIIEYVENNSDVQRIVIGRMPIEEALSAVKARANLAAQYKAARSRGYTGSEQDFIEKMGGLEREMQKIKDEQQQQRIGPEIRYFR